MLQKIGTPGRLIIVAMLLLGIHFLGSSVRGMLTPAEVVLPEWHLDEMPLELGDWRGQMTELDDQIFNRIGAAEANDWIYERRDGRTASAHLALFKDLDEGVWHYPANCYKASGWHNIDSREETLFVEGAPERRVSISTWSHSGRTVKVLYWYQLGEHTIFGRLDLGKARLALAGQATWPPLVKVLLQTDADNSVEAEQALIDLGGRIHGWLAAKGGLGAEEAAETTEDPGDEELSPMPAVPLDGGDHGGDDPLPPLDPLGSPEPGLPAAS